MPLSSNLPAPCGAALPALKRDGACLRLRPSAMRTNMIDGIIPSGTSLLSGLRKACREAGIAFSNLRYAKVFIDGVPVGYEAWHRTLVREGQMVSVCIPLGKGGGKNPLGTILTLAVMMVAAATGNWVAGAKIFAEGAALAGWGSAVGGLASGAVMMGGMLLVNAIAGVSQPKLAQADTETAAKVWSIDGAQNRADPYGVVPLVLGKIRFAPRFAAQYYTVLSGNDQFVRYLYVVSMGNVQVSDFRIGDTPFGHFQGSEYRIYQNWQGGDFAWFNRAVSEEALGVLLKKSVGWTTRTTKANTTHIAIFLSFNGLKKINQKGNSSPVTVEMEVRYRPVGASAWTPVSGTRSTEGGKVRVVDLRRGVGTFTIGITASNTLKVNGGYPIARGTVVMRMEHTDGENSGSRSKITYYGIEHLEKINGFTGSIATHDNFSVTVGSGSVMAPALSFSGQTVTTQRRGVEFDVPEGQYEVSVRRVTPDSDKETTKETVMDECTWTALQSWRDRPAVIYQGKPLTLIEVQLKATEQLSGNVDEFNCRCQSVAPCWTGKLWEWRPTNNPASLALLVATDKCTGRPAAWEEMDLDAYADFYEWCERWGWAYNAVQTSRITAGELQHNIMGAGRGSYALLNGHGVVWDDPEAPVVEILSPRNTWGFSAKKEFLTEPVQGLRMRFLNETKDFQEDERIVYADGYDETNAANVIEWEQDGVTHPDLVWKHGRLRLAELRLRPETYTLNAEAESLTLRRGEHVRCQHDVTLWGMASGRVVGRELDAEGKILSVDLDEECTMEAGKNYGIRVSTPANPDVYYSLRTVPGVSRTLPLAMPIPDAATAPGIGDLVAFGVTGRETQMLTVLGVSPSEGLTAQITLQDAASNMYAAIAGAIPAWDSNITAPTRYQANMPPTPRITNVISDESVLTQLADGTLMPRILLNWEIADSPVAIDSWQIMRRMAGESAWTVMPERNAGGLFAYVSDVAEGKTYELAVRALSATGVMSEPSAVIAHKVVGKSRRPPDVTNVGLTLAPPLGIRVSWDAVDTLDVSHYLVSGDLAGRASGTSLTVPPYGLTGTVTASVVAVDTLGLVSENPVSASIAILPPAKPVITSASLQREGIAVSWRDAARTWPVARYAVTLGGATFISQTATVVIPVPRSFEAGDAVTVQAVDIFNNAGEVSGAVAVAITPPKTPRVALALNAEDGTILVSWQDCATVCPIRHYVISGAMSGTSTGTSASLPAPKKAGAVTVQVVAVDAYGIESDAGQATLSVSAPENPVIRTEVRTDGLYLAWQDCATSWPIRHYVITDPWAGETYTSLVTSQAVPPRPAGTYLFGVRAVDAVGLASSTIYASAELGGVGRAAPSIRVDGADLVISWPLVASSFPIDRYEIVTVQGREVGSAKTTYHRFPCPAAGTHGYRVRAVDAAGNAGEWGEASIAVTRPEPPQVTAALDGPGISVRWKATGHQLPIVAWDLVRQWEEARADGLIETHEEDYGRLDVDCLTVPAVSTGTHWFMVRAVDSAGNISGWGDADFTVVPPGRVTFENCAAVDNNVMLYWTEPSTVFFPIREYVFSEIDEDGYEMEIGRIDAQFASSFETVSGEYVYGVTPVDAGGNRGALSTITMTVSQPPDFVFYHNLDSLFNGTKTGLVLDGRGSMIGPVPDETWEENLRRATEAAGKNIETWQDKIGAGFLAWMAPPAASAVYVETVDVGKLVPSTKITVTISSRTLSGNPSFACKIEVSQDGAEWRLMADDATLVYATQFRYVRYTITLTGGMAAISNINYSLDVKRKTDFGRVEVKAADNGAGWKSESETPMLTGKWVDFKVGFIDVESLPKPNVVNNQNLTAFTVFEDVENPRGFRIFVKDKNGNRAAGTVDWAAYGV